MNDTINKILQAMDEMGPTEKECFLLAIGCITCRRFDVCEFGQQVARQPLVLAEVVQDSYPSDPPGSEELQR